MSTSTSPMLPPSDPESDRKLLAAELLVSLAKLLTAIANPALALGTELVASAIKAVVDHQARKRNEQLETCLRELIEKIRKSEEIQKKLAELPGEKAEPLVRVFSWTLESAYRDDEEAKARYYAAFAVGVMGRGGFAAWAWSHHVALCDAMRRLRAHELYVLILLAKTQETSPGPIIVELKGGVRLEKQRPEKVRHEEELVTFYSTAQALCSMAGIGLVQQQAYGFGQMGASPPVNAYHLAKPGMDLARILAPHLSDIRPLPDPLPPDDWDKLLH